MPINKKGGKNCKKGKNSNAKEDEMIFMVECNKNDGQMFGRVTKVLGDKRFSVRCNDGKDRVCKLSGTIRKNDRVELNGIVLISIRDPTLDSMNSDSNRGDIIANVDPRLHKHLKEMEGINPILFLTGDKESDVIDDIFDRNAGDDDDDDRKTPDETQEIKEAKEAKKLTKEDIAELELSKRKEMMERDKKRNTKYEGEISLADL
jgi:translation initiation factor 1A